MPEPRRLTRSETDRMIAGVAGGLAEHLGLDPTLVRIGFVLLAVFGGSGVLVYLALWLIVPRASRVGQSADETLRGGVSEVRKTAKRLTDDVRQGWQAGRDKSSSGDG